MHSFKDSVGREWSISLTVADIRRVRDKANLNLADPQIGDTLDKIWDDPVVLVDTLFVLVDADAVKLGVNRDQFAAGFWGEAINDARAALMGALLDFFPKDPRLIERMRAWVEKHGGMSPIGTPSSELPESAESTPGPGPQEI